MNAKVKLVLVTLAALLAAMSMAGCCVPVPVDDYGYTINKGTAKELQQIQENWSTWFTDTVNTDTVNTVNTESLTIIGVTPVITTTPTITGTDIITAATGCPVAPITGTDIITATTVTSCNMITQ